MAVLQPKKMTINTLYRFYLAVMALLAFLFWLYQPALGAALVWDDSYLLERYGALSPAQWFNGIFTAHYISPEYYRPLAALSLALNAWGGEATFAWHAHLFNVILWLGCVLLIICLTWKASHQNPYVAWSAGLLFGIHPAMIEPVAWISGRCDLLATFFILAGLWVEIRCRHQMVRLALLFVAMLLALLSKEAAVVFPVILMAWRFHVGQGRPDPSRPRIIWRWLWGRDNRAYLLLIGGVFISYFGLRYCALGHLLAPYGITSDVRDIGGVMNHVLLVGKTFWYYLLLQLLPHLDISVVYPTTYPVPLDDYEGWLGIAALLLVLLLAINAILPGIHNHNLLIILALFVPMSNLRPLITHDNFIHLRFLMLPAACAIVFLYPAFMAFVLRQKALIKNALLGVIALWMLAGFGNIKATLPLWVNEESLWKWAIESKPESHIAWDNYASAMIAKRDYAACIEAAQTSIRLFPEKPKAYLAMTVCHRATGNEQAARYYASILLSQPVKRDKGVFSGLLTELAQMDIGELAKQETSIAAASDMQARRIDKSLEQALTLDPDNRHAALLQIAWLYLRGADEVLESAIIRLVETGAKKEMAINTLGNFSFLKPVEREQLKLVLQAAYANRSGELP